MATAASLASAKAAEKAERAQEEAAATLSAEQHAKVLSNIEYHNGKAATHNVGRYFYLDRADSYFLKSTLESGTSTFKVAQLRGGKAIFTGNVEIWQQPTDVAKGPLGNCHGPRTDGSANSQFEVDDTLVFVKAAAAKATFTIVPGTQGVEETEW